MLRITPVEAELAYLKAKIEAYEQIVKDLTELVCSLRAIGCPRCPEKKIKLLSPYKN
jgi:hypothetical protein